MQKTFTPYGGKKHSHKTCAFLCIVLLYLVLKMEKTSMSLMKDIKSSIKKLNNPHYIAKTIEILKRKAIFITDLEVFMQEADSWSHENCKSDYHSFLAQYSNGYLGATDFILNVASCCDISNDITVNAIASYSRYAEILAQD